MNLSATESLSRHAPGTRRFEFFVALCVIAILATGLLYALNQAQGEIEKATQNTALNNLRLELMEVWVHKTMTNQAADIETLKGSNPMRLLADKPNNYIGELAQAPSDNQAIWYFDIQKKRLIYVFNDGRQAAYMLAGSAPALRGLDLILDVKN